MKNSIGGIVAIAAFVAIGFIAFIAGRTLYASAVARGVSHALSDPATMELQIAVVDAALHRAAADSELVAALERAIAVGVSNGQLAAMGQLFRPSMAPPPGPAPGRPLVRKTIAASTWPDTIFVGVDDGDTVSVNF